MTKALLFATTIMVPTLIGASAQQATAAERRNGSAASADRTPVRRGAAGHAAARPVARQADAARPAAGSETILVYGQGSTRQMTSVTRTMLAETVPGTSPMKVLNRLPGVMYQSADPFGAYEYSSSLYMRGFSQSQLGFTLDDVPLGDQQFNNYNGLSITRAISTDNVSGVDVSQGAGAIDVASTSNLGGAMQFHSRDPSHQRGGTVEQTFGSNSTFRTFVRLDSGDLNATGTRFYVSYARTSLNLWKGGGYNYSDQANAKFVQPLARGSSLKAFFDWSSIQQFDYQDMSLDYLHTVGSHLSNYYPDYTAAYEAAQGKFRPQIAKTGDPLDAAYYAGTANRQDFLGGVTLDENLNEHLNWKTTLYGHGDSGYSTWTTPYTPSPNGSPLSVRTQNPGILRGGALSALTHRYGANTFNMGVWYEFGQFTEGRYFSSTPLLGQGTLGNPTDHFPTDIFSNPWAEKWQTSTFQFHVQDTYRITPDLKVNAGFRSMVVRSGNQVINQVPALNGGNEVAQGRLTASNAFLPQVSANWRFLPHQELFFDVSHNMRAFPEDGYGTNVSATPWTANQKAFTATARTLKPETDWVYEGGYRYTTPLVSGLLSAYRMNFSNRLQLVSTGPIVAPTTAVQNVGGVTTNGVEGSVTLRPLNGLSIYNSISYAHSTYDQNVQTSSGLEPTKGKLIPNYPTLMYKGSIAYEWRDWTMHIDGNYLSRRYITYTDDAKVPGYFLANVGARYRFGKLSVLKNVTASFNIYNLFNKTYVATTGELGNSFTGSPQTFLMGAPRQFFGTISADF